MSALRAMSVEDFGNLFVGLPLEKQQELDALVKQKFENGEFFKEGTSGQEYSDSIAGSTGYNKPWEETDGYNLEEGVENWQAGSSGFQHRETVVMGNSRAGEVESNRIIQLGPLSNNMISMLKRRVH